ncbi:TetR/AcrR family transcriptional regulator [Paenibacillus sp. GD4]|uniref:TetR/AcrR family transcriptional regulator n=1 Tax=Paenibacillus sp. GD4 TaxID=3068890 RepID=UPI0027967BD8|nr:TetR/AcrR family transcriptional regulator [Paenibacillus sp. GD4]MDQ1911416.1 TetR/AcrR family transcriptional regulator [Paenibacillus sp. GD4]
MPRVVVTEEQWIQKGMERFALHGAEGLVIEQMSSELGCSKSSFYWYFSHRDEFLKRIIDKWTEITTSQVIRRSSEQESAEEKITGLLRQMFSATRKGDFLFYLRKLSEQQSDYRNVIDRVEQERMNYACGLFMDAGLPSEAAYHKSHILYHYYLGWYERHKHELISEEALQQHIDMLRKHLLGI